MNKGQKKQVKLSQPFVNLAERLAVTVVHFELLSRSFGRMAEMCRKLKRERRSTLVKTAEWRIPIRIRGEESEPT